VTYKLFNFLCTMCKQVTCRMYIRVWKALTFIVRSSRDFNTGILGKLGVCLSSRAFELLKKVLRSSLSFTIKQMSCIVHENSTLGVWY